MIEFYYFGGFFGKEESLKSVESLEKNNFSGVMYTYDATQGDMFVRIAKDIKLDKKIKYLVAIRPYTISPQYLCAINDSISEIMKDRLQINFIGGYTKDHEDHVGGIVGDINDQSSIMEKQKYLISFLETLNKMETNKLNFFVSTTNKYVFDIVKKYNNKIILPYSIYFRKTWTDSSSSEGYSTKDTVYIDNVETMLALTPIIRKTKEELDQLTDYAIRPIWKKGEKRKVVNDVEYFTPESFDKFVKDLEKNGVKYLLINAVPNEENRVVIPFIKNYVEQRKKEKNEV
jgi:hypothetical protein